MHARSRARVDQVDQEIRAVTCLYQCLFLLHIDDNH